LVVATSLWAKAPDTAPSREREFAEEHVRAALQAELAGNWLDRADRLERARTWDATYAPAQWHSGRLWSADRWLSVAEAEKAACTNEKLAEYRALQQRAGSDPRRMQQLARWCRKAGWDDVAGVHYAHLLLNPAATADMQKEARQHLGVSIVDGRYLTQAEIQQEAEQTARLQTALRTWSGRLSQWQVRIDNPRHQQHKSALEELRQVDDPNIIPVLESFSAQGSELFQAEILSLLARFSQPEATEALARIAILSKSENLRGRAITALKPRPKHDYYPLLLAGLVAPVKSRFQITRAPNGTIEYDHRFLRESPLQNYAYRNNEVAVGTVATVFNNARDLRKPENHASLTLYAFAGIVPAPTLEGEMLLLEKMLRASAAEQSVAAANSQAKVNNQPVFLVLEQTSPVQLPQDPVKWWSWWKEYNEYHYPTPTQPLYTFHRQSYVSLLSVYNPTIYGMSCFVAGTKVRAETGLVNIETIRPGDRVLSQDVETGELAYRTVLAKTVRPPSPVLRLQIGPETIATTKGHPFWVASKGWVMAKELAVGDQLHTALDAVLLENVAPAAKPKEAHNLVVDGTHTYFVGEQGILVHDNLYWTPTTALLPGLHKDK